MRQNPVISAWTMLLMAVCSPLAPASAVADELRPREITTTGQAEVRVVPDEVILTLGIETMDKGLAEAKRQNDERTRAILALAEKFGIKPEKTQTDHFDIEPQYKDGNPFADGNDQQVNLRGYFVRKTVVFTLRDVSKIDALVTAALEAGANYVHGIEFRTTELRKHRDAARAMAVRAAREKAAALAAELDQGVGQPRTINEGYAGWQYWGGSGYWGSRGYGGYAGYNNVQNSISSAGDARVSDDGIALGQISVSASVTVTFDLK